MKQDPAVYFILALCVAWVALFVCIYRRHLAERRREFEAMAKEEQSAPNTATCKAVVVSNNSEIVYISRNPKYPQHKLIYTVTFSVGTEQVTHEVNRQVFECVYSGQCGTLITVNEKFLDFDA